MTDRTCNGCRFWARSFYRPGFGECRRLSPTLTTAELGTEDVEGFFEFRVWPVTRDADWCGSFTARPAPKVDDEDVREAVRQKREAAEFEREKPQPKGQTRASSDQTRRPKDHH